MTGHEDGAEPDPLEEMINLNFRVSERERRAFKSWCAENGMTLTEGFREGVTVLRGLRVLFGTLRAEELLMMVNQIKSMKIDRERDRTSDPE